MMAQSRRQSKITELKGESNAPYSYRFRPVTKKNKKENKAAKIGGAIVVLGALAAVGKAGWNWWFGSQEEVITPKEKAPHVDPLPLIKVEGDVLEVAETPGNIDSNNSCFTLGQEAHEAHIAVSSLSLMQLYLLSVSEEESNSSCHFFRDKYAIELAKTAKKPHVL